MLYQSGHFVIPKTSTLYQRIVMWPLGGDLPWPVGPSIHQQSVSCSGSKTLFEILEGLVELQSHGNRCRKKYVSLRNLE